ncbi:MAG: glycosyltransferase WbuB [Chloroflexota bacterium]|nr:MAG: glycosyltransferase WbuB [Chloroflexota bacterium]
MRVAMLGPFGLKPKGTMAVRALPLAKALTRRGYDVALFLPPWSYPQDGGRVWEENGVRIENVTIAPRAQIPFRLLARARAFQPDVIHIFKPKGYAGIAQWLGWQARRVGRMRARIILDTDDWEGAGGWNELEPYSWAQKKFFAWQEQWGLRHADAVTVASRALETIVWSLGVAREKVLYLPNGANPLPVSDVTPAQIRQELGLGDAPVMLLYTRFFEFDLARAVEILSRVFARMPNAKLLLVGKGLFGEEKKFLEMAAANGWRERVVDAGWVEAEKLRAYFAASDVGLFPFDDTLVNRCKCSVKLIDLLANGVPVVAEAVGQVREYISHNTSGMLVAPNDVNGFANCLSELLEDREKRAWLGANAVGRIKQDFDWSRLAARVEEVYRV